MQSVVLARTVGAHGPAQDLDGEETDDASRTPTRTATALAGRRRPAGRRLLLLLLLLDWVEVALILPPSPNGRVRYGALPPPVSVGGRYDRAIVAQERLLL